MNQILITQNDNGNNRNNKNPEKNKLNKNNVRKSTSNNYSTEISSILRVFAILIIVFGLALSGSGVYATMQNKENSKSTNKPDVTMQRNGNIVTVVIKCNTGIRSVSYSWNDSPEKVLQGRNQTEFEQEFTIPTGNNRLNISVIDSKGKQWKQFIKNFAQAEEDTTEPVIELEVVNSNVKIVVTDDTALDYIVYKYGEQEEVKINATQEGQTKIEETIPALQGQNKLIVEAIDKAENVATKEQEIKGANKPTIEVSCDQNDPSYIIIKATDEEGLRMVSFYINEQEYKTDPNTSLNSKTFEWRQKVEHGENKITIHAYNINELMTEVIAIYDYK